ncbi:LD-carboxypeptidase [Sporolactobacillus sp. CPB3-1]|uniref:LD-carboxypeptidase n=1 Tax=Sporolactobacillus mangiferae TaxID=2940498 RepID=A0ABT0MD72_9BACL|nr:S66 peptidase family protein [Sporolactobacillus mangiferae]MCL1632816.1 LD-carboxypeptidase [Sporolactobacillus mangiferae]
MLKPGDTVAAVSSSWGGAGDEAINWRYRQGRERLEQVFGLKVVELPNTLKGTDYVYNHPEKRAEDLMQAFLDPSIKGIISCIGGSDSIRLLPYIDFGVIRNNPKIVTGYSDSTVTHFFCLKAGISSFYGLSLLNDLAENIKMPDYTEHWVRKVLFSKGPIGEIPVSKEYTSQRLEWVIENKNVARKFEANSDYELLQGHETATGRLIGGCLEVIDMIKGTSLFPELSDFDDAILFLETSEEMPPIWLLEDSLRSYGVMGIFDRVNGLIFGKPYRGTFYQEYKEVIKMILAEFGKEELPVLYNASFGHNEPKCLLPYGAFAEIRCDKPGFAILESGVEV